MNIDIFPAGMRRWGVVKATGGIVWIGSPVEDGWKGVDPGGERAEVARFREEERLGEPMLLAILESTKVED